MNLVRHSPPDSIVVVLRGCGYAKLSTNNQDGFPPSKNRSGHAANWGWWYDDLTTVSFAMKLEKFAKLVAVISLVVVIFFFAKRTNRSYVTSFVGNPPVTASQSVTVGQRVTASQPATVSQPVTASQPITASQPVTASQPPSPKPLHDIKHDAPSSKSSISKSGIYIDTIAIVSMVFNLLLCETKAIIVQIAVGVSDGYEHNRISDQ